MPLTSHCHFAGAMPLAPCQHSARAMPSALRFFDPSDTFRTLWSFNASDAFVTGLDPNSTLEFEPNPVRVRHLMRAGHK
ncbi:unnamed protein product [Prunus armeniaca]